jgi:hypothetical protein
MMIRKSYLFLLILISSFLFGCLVDFDYDNSRPQVVTISGKINFNGEGLEGAIITLSGDALMETSTNSDGEYSFSGMEQGCYIITPQLQGYEFSPDSLDIVVTDEDLRGNNLEAYTENSPPELASLEDITTHQEHVIELAVAAWDADGDHLIYSAKPLPYGATFVTEDDCAVFEWLPGEGTAGRYDITFTVADNGIPNLSDSETITITILSTENRVFPPIDDFSERGPFSTRSSNRNGPDGAFSLYYPKNLGQDGLKHPVITWGNGTNAIPFFYSGLLEHWASHGFVVIASNSRMTGSGEEMLEGVDWLISENCREDSPFFNKININAVGASGHSQGGGGAINVGHSPKVECIAPIQPSPGNARGILSPMFVIAGSRDTIISPDLVERRVYNPSTVPTVFGILNGATHFTPLGSAQGIRGYLTAWFRFHLMKDDFAWDIFYGENCGICNDNAWSVERKGL